MGRAITGGRRTPKLPSAWPKTLNLIDLQPPDALVFPLPDGLGEGATMEYLLDANPEEVSTVRRLIWSVRATTSSRVPPLRLRCIEGLAKTLVLAPAA